MKAGLNALSSDEPRDEKFGINLQHKHCFELKYLATDFCVSINVSSHPLTFPRILFVHTLTKAVAVLPEIILGLVWRDVSAYLSPFLLLMQPIFSPYYKSESQNNTVVYLAIRASF